MTDKDTINHTFTGTSTITGTIDIQLQIQLQVQIQLHMQVQIQVESIRGTIRERVTITYKAIDTNTIADADTGTIILFYSILHIKVPIQIPLWTQIPI